MSDKPGTTDEELLARFQASELESFPHEDHLAVVFALLRVAPIDAGIERMSAGVLAMAVAKGHPEAFHVTRTVAWARVVAEAMRTSSATQSSQLLAEHPELLRRDLLEDYYGNGVLTSSDARTRFVEPDLRTWSGDAACA